MQPRIRRPRRGGFVGRCRDHGFRCARGYFPEAPPGASSAAVCEAFPEAASRGRSRLC